MVRIAVKEKYLWLFRIRLSEEKAREFMQDLQQWFAAHEVTTHDNVHFRVVSELDIESATRARNAVADKYPSALLAGGGKLGSDGS